MAKASTKTTAADGSEATSEATATDTAAATAATGQPDLTIVTPQSDLAAPPAELAAATASIDFPGEPLDEGAVVDVTRSADAPRTLIEAVGKASKDAERAGEHASHSVLNSIELKLSELRNLIANSKGVVADEYRHVLDWFEQL